MGAKKKERERKRDKERQRQREKEVRQMPLFLVKPSFPLPFSQGRAQTTLIDSISSKSPETDSSCSIQDTSKG